MNQKLTPARKRALDTYYNLLHKNGYPPSIREFGEAYGCSSSSTAHSILRTLRKCGFDVYTRGQDKNEKDRAAVWGLKVQQIANETKQLTDVQYWLTAAYRRMTSGQFDFTDLNRLQRILDNRDGTAAAS